MFEGYLKIAALTGGDGVGAGDDEFLRLAQDYLVQSVAKFDLHFERANVFHSVV